LPPCAVTSTATLKKVSGHKISSLATGENFMKDVFSKPVLFFAALVTSAVARADYEVQMNLVDAGGIGKSIGHIKISETEHGTLFTPSLRDLPAGSLGFHVHQNPSCEPAAKGDTPREPGQAAGSHYDPDNTKKHAGPMGEGHRGDLPTLSVANDGTATQPVLAPHLELDEVKNKSLIIHAGNDNYSDKPEPSGGSGKRIACGVIKSDEA
jgi:superoxide dismutase, Cu-Zn family